MASLLGGSQSVISSSITNNITGLDPKKLLYRAWQLDHTSTSVTAFGGTAPTPTGTRTVFTDTTGSYVNHATTTALGNSAGWTDAERVVCQRQLLPDITYVMKTGAAAADIADCRINIGVVSSTVGGTDTPTGHFALFTYYTTLSNTTWQCRTRDNVTTATTDSGVALAVNTRYVLRFDMTTSGFVKFYINDALVASHSSNLPGATTSLLTSAIIENRNVASARAMRIAGLTAVVG